MTIRIRRQLWMALRVIAWVALVTGTLPGVLLLGVVGLIGVEYFYGSVSAGGHELFVIGPMIVALILAPIAVPILLWFGFTKTLIAVNQDYLIIRQVGLVTRRELRWPTHLVGDVRMDGSRVGVFSVDGRKLAAVDAFTRPEEELIVTLLRDELGLGMEVGSHAG